MHRISRLRTSSVVMIALSLVFGTDVRTDGQDVIQQRTFRDADGEHRYGLFIPTGYTPEKKWPVILFLHGAGERGRDGTRQLGVGLGPVVRQKADQFPFIAVFPQCEDMETRYLAGWVDGSRDAQRALAILETVEKEFSIDTKRRVLTGWSMGGYGTWSVAAANPDHWSAIVPLAGGGGPEMAKPLASKHVWAFHGSNDAAIRSSQSRRMITALREAGGQPRYTEVTGGGHDITELVYGNDQLIAWMLNPDNSQPAALALSVKRTSPVDVLASDSGTTAPPFTPAVILKG
ncbi:MAG: prolyl oligopeptidase family serine peptidase, partial [Planctomycetaceae bacterium]